MGRERARGRGEMRPPPKKKRRRAPFRGGRTSGGERKAACRGRGGGGTPRPFCRRPLSRLEKLHKDAKQRKTTRQEKGGGKHINPNRRGRRTQTTTEYKLYVFCFIRKTGLRRGGGDKKKTRKKKRFPLLSSMSTATSDSPPLSLSPSLSRSKLALCLSISLSLSLPG